MKIRAIIPFLLLFPLSQMTYAQTCDRLKVSGSNRWVPIAFVANDQASGIAYDISRHIANKLNLPIEINEQIAWARAMRNLEQGELDFIAGAYFTEERQNKFLMTQAISQDTLSIYVKKGNEFPFRTLDDLLDKRVDIRRKSSNGQAFDEFVETRLDPSLTNTVDNYEQLFLRLDAYRTDYVVLDTYTGGQVLKKLNLQEEIVPLDQALVTNPIHIVMSKLSPCAKHFNAIDQIIKQAKEDGTLDRIHQKYY